LPRREDGRQRRPGEDHDRLAIGIGQPDQPNASPEVIATCSSASAIRSLGESTSTAMSGGIGTTVRDSGPALGSRSRSTNAASGARIV
jgi:hypothetical protein